MSKWGQCNQIQKNQKEFTEGDYKVVEHINNSYFELLVRIDNNDYYNLPVVASLNYTQYILIESKINSSFIEDIRDSKERIAVAMRAPDDKLYYESEFGAIGTTFAAKKILENCKPTNQDLKPALRRSESGDEI